MSGEREAVPVAPDLDSFGREYPDNFAAAGRQLAVEHCASCHAIDHNSISPNRNAPPMNTLLSRYDADTLTDDLVAGVWVGHAGMPLFDFNVIAADSLVAYLETINKGLGDR
jgi:mono/diheme cytochrome c family protein